MEGRKPEGIATATPDIALLPWDESGPALLRQMNTPAQKLHLGGPESEAKLPERHARYLTYHRPGDVEMLRIAADGAIVGSIGYWQIERAGVPAYEAGWEILATHHGRGIGGTAAARLLGVERIEYPAGIFGPHNVWRLDLAAFPPPPPERPTHNPLKSATLSAPWMPGRPR